MKYLLTVLLIASISPRTMAQVVDPHNIIIENIYIATEYADDVLVNLLISENELELLSKDTIPVPDGFVALDAAGGYLIGDLTLGEPPNFIILDMDPRADMEALLDTRAHTMYAVYKGELRKNTLQNVNKTFADKPENPTWHAYTPPPVALPTHYDSKGAWNHWTTENTKNAFFSVLALDRQYWLSQNNASEQQVGNIDDFDGGEIRDFRLGIYGTLNYFGRPWGYTAVVATNAFKKRFEIDDQDHFKSLDYRLDIPVGDSMKLSIGKQKEPISMERTMTLIDLPMQERSSAANAFLLSRNVGALLSGNALDRRMSWAGGIFNDSIDNDETNGSSTTSASGRMTWLPYVAEDKSSLLHLGIAVKLAEGDHGYTYFTNPELNKSPIFVDTGPGDADIISQYDLEASWRHGPFWLAGEYVGTIVDSPTHGDLDFSGYYISASWILTGEMRDYHYKNGTFGSVPISRSAYQSGPGAWELSARWSSTDLNDGPITGGEMDILSLGASWWLSPAFNINLNYRYIFNERYNLDGETSGMNIRVMLRLQ